MYNRRFFDPAKSLFKNDGMKVRFGYTAKPRKFEYKPRYYDPEKEAKEKRRDELLGPKAGPSGREYVPGEIIRSRMGARHDALRQRRSGKGKTVVLIIAVMALIAAAAWILMTPYFQSIIENILN